jgi:hypothetical protein
MSPWRLLANQYGLLDNVPFKIKIAAKTKEKTGISQRRPFAAQRSFYTRD